MRILLTWFALTTTTVFAAPGDPGTPEHRKAADLVKQLGHARYAVREAAARQLVEMGGAAAAALREGQKSTDEEVRARSVTLLAQAITLDWQRKADAYLADADGKQIHALPLLADFEKLLGKPDAEARKLFAAMLKANGPLLETTATDPEGSPQGTADRVRCSRRPIGSGSGQIKIDPAEIASVLFVHALDKEKASRPTDWMTTLAAAGEPGSLTPSPGAAFASSWPGGLSPARGGRHVLPVLLHGRPQVLAPGGNGDSDHGREGPEGERDDRPRPAVESLGKAGGPEATAALRDPTDATEVINFNAGGGGEVPDRRCGTLRAGYDPQEERTDYGFGNEMSIGFAFGDGNEQDNIIMLSLNGFASPEARKKAVQKRKDETAKKK